MQLIQYIENVVHLLLNVNETLQTCNQNKSS